MGAHNHYGRSGLFLVRIWAEDAEDGTGQVECHGKVQRVVDGRYHQFKSRRGLLDALFAMVPALDNKGAMTEPPKHSGDDAIK